MDSDLASSCLVLGLGNVLLQDEGVGVYAVEELARRYVIPDNVEVMDGGTSAWELLEPLRGREYVVIADAVNADALPGTLIRLVDEEIPALFQTKISPHQVGLSDVLASLKLTGETPEHIILLGMVPQSLKTRLGLSDIVADKLELLVDSLAGELRLLGIRILPRKDVRPGFWSKATV